ncbi:hypothetical protein Ahia01_000767100 [Argonauta hians]
MAETKNFVSFEDFRLKYWRTYPEALVKMSDIFWNYHKMNSSSLKRFGFFDKYRLKKYSKKFHYREDIIYLAISMNFSWKVVDRLIGDHSVDINRLGEILLTNYILLSHEGDEKTVTDLVEMLFKNNQGLLGMEIQQEFEHWSRIHYVKYEKLYEIEKKLRCGKTEKQLRVFGFEQKGTPERFFDYLGNFCSLKTCDKEKLVNLTKNDLNDMTMELLKNAPVEFGFQYLPSASKYCYDSNIVLPLEWVNTVSDKKYYVSEKLLLEFSEYAFDKLKFYDFLFKNFIKEFDVLMRILDNASAKSKPTFHMLIHVLESTTTSSEYSKTLATLKMFKPFKEFLENNELFQVEKIISFKNISPNEALIYIIIMILFYNCFKKRTIL